MKKLHYFLLLAMAALILLTTCKKEESLDEKIEPDIPETTKVISDTDWEELIRAIDTTDYTFSFEQNPGVSEGDILVSSVDGGYLRKVTGIKQEGGQIVVETEFASITEAIRNADIEYSKALTVNEKALEKAFLKDGVTIDHDLLKDSDQTNLNFNIDFIIYDADGNPNTTSDQIKMAGNFGTSTSFSAKVKIEDFDLEELSFTYDIEKEKSLNISCGLASLILEKEERIARIPFHDIVIPAGIPITIQPVLELYAGVNFELGSQIQMGVSETVDYVTSISYQNGEWSTTKTVDEFFDYTPPSLAANLKAEAYIKPKLLFKIYRVLSPKVEAKLYGLLEAHTRAIDWELSEGFTAGLGVEMKIWKHTIFDFTANVIDIEYIVAEGTIGGGNPPVAAFTATPTNGTAPLTVSFTDQSTNNPTSWQWNFGDGNTSAQQNPQHTYQNAGTYTVAFTVTNSYGSDTETKTNYITVTSGGGGFNDVFNPATGKTWMDRNLGASRAATSSTDDQAYGDLYQWGRLTDGHQNRTSPTTLTLSNEDVPGHGNFITVGSSSPYDWRSPQNNNLWQGVSGTNNPCPAGYRLPTDAEWEAERQSWSSNNAAGAFNSPLKLPVAGSRSYSNGSLGNVGSYGYYWSATAAGIYARRLFFNSSNASMIGHYRARGYSVRCLKD